MSIPGFTPMLGSDHGRVFRRRGWGYLPYAYILTLHVALATHPSALWANGASGPEPDVYSIAGVGALRRCAAGWRRGNR